MVDVILGKQENSYVGFSVGLSSKGDIMTYGVAIDTNEQGDNVGAGYVLDISQYN